MMAAQLIAAHNTAMECYAPCSLAFETDPPLAQQIRPVLVEGNAAVLPEHQMSLKNGLIRATTTAAAGCQLVAR
jgi:hypothetical protein